MPNKTANLCVRIDPEVKEQAEKILNDLGLSPSSAITLFYNQIILREGLPFAVCKFDDHILFNCTNQREYDEICAQGYKDYIDSRLKHYREVFCLPEDMFKFEDHTKKEEDKNKKDS